MIRQVRPFIIPLLIIILFPSLSFSVFYDEPGLTTNSWRVYSYRESDTTGVKIPLANRYGPEGNYILNFNANGTAVLNIYDNCSGGNYHLTEKGGIRINVCRKETARCCPSPSDGIMLSLLSTIRNYSIHSDTLSLTGPGTEINLVKIPGKKIEIIERFDSNE